LALRIKERREDSLRALLKSLPRHFEPAGPRKVSVKTTSGFAIIEAIADCFHLPQEFTQNELTDIIRDAIGDIVGKPSDDPQKFARIAEKHSRRWHRAPLRRYELWTRINFRPQRAIQVTHGEFKVKLTGSLPPKFRTGKASAYQDLSQTFGDVDGGVLAVSGSFRNYTSAGYKLGSIIAEFIGTLNFEYNRHLGLVEPEEARAFFVAGPTNYLLMPDGSYGGAVWSNPDFLAEHFAVRPRANVHFDKGVQTARLIQRRRRNNRLLPSAMRCISLLDSYYTSRANTSKLVQVWSCFEHLFSMSADGSRASYDQIAKRAAKFDNDPLVRQSLLLALAGRRNLAAHSKEATGSCDVAQELASEAAGYIRWLIEWTIANGTTFKSKQEFLDWVDIPKDREALLSRIVLHKRAFKYWHPKRSP